MQGCINFSDTIFPQLRGGLISLHGKHGKGILFSIALTAILTITCEDQLSVKYVRNKKPMNEKLCVSCCTHHGHV